MRLLGLVILTLAALAGIFIYDYKERRKKKRILHELWRIAGKTDTVVGMPVRKVKLMYACNIHPSDFATIVTKLDKEKILKVDMDSIEFTEYGKNYYEFKVKPKRVVRG